MASFTELLGWFLIASGVVALLPLLAGRDHGRHVTPMSWRRLRLSLVWPLSLGCSTFALNAHGLTMWLLRVPIEVYALYALISTVLWFKSRRLRGFPVWRF
jgi:hypothetical protein